MPGTTGGLAGMRRTVGQTGTTVDCRLVEHGGSDFPTLENSPPSLPCGVGSHPPRGRDHSCRIAEPGSCGESPTGFGAGETA